MQTTQTIVRQVDGTGDTSRWDGAIVPGKQPVRVRPATVADLEFIDTLQKKQSRELGFLPTMALVGKIKLGQILIAEVGLTTDFTDDTDSEFGPRRRSVKTGLEAEHAGTFAGEKIRSIDERATQAVTGSSESAQSVKSVVRPSPVGYLIAADRYFKRDEVGYITQINVLSEYRRSLVAAQLLQAQFDRSAYGCRLYGLWCAQDLKANEFWEAMGFTAIAFRMGARGKGEPATKSTARKGFPRRARRDTNGENQGMGLKTNSAGNENEQKNDSCDFVNFVGDTSDCSDASAAVSSVVRPVSGPKARGPRVHIFWQKRIRANDASTPWWYPAQTGGGEMREDRLVFPIMPGVNWRDVTPIELDQTGFTTENAEKSEGEKPRMSRMGTNGDKQGKENEPGNDSCEFVNFVGGSSDSSDSSAAVSVGVKSSARSKTRRAVERAGREALERARAAPTFMSGGLWFEPEVDEQAINDAREKEQADAQAQRALVKAKQKQAAKIDPRLTALARELRDQWQERVAPTMTAEAGKYDVRRVIEQKEPTPPLLHAA